MTKRDRQHFISYEDEDFVRHDNAVVRERNGNLLWVERECGESGEWIDRFQLVTD